MSRRLLAWVGLVLWGIFVAGLACRRANAQESVARPDEVVHDQVKGAMAPDVETRNGGGSSAEPRCSMPTRWNLPMVRGSSWTSRFPTASKWRWRGTRSIQRRQEAAAYLRSLVGDKPVMCIRESAGKGPWSAFVGDTNLERAMVVGGWALADHSSLHGDEIIARENKRGLWRGRFVDFDDWRAGIRLPGEQPPGKLADERQANALLARCASSEPACAKVVERIIQDLPGMRRLNFPNGSHVTDEILAQFPRLAKLEELSLLLSGGVTDAGLARLQELPGLKRFGYPHSGTDAGMEHLGHLKQLEELSIAWSQNVTDAGFRHLRGLSQLRRLSVHNIKITDAALANLSGLTDLEVLDLNQDGITDAAMVHLQPLTKLAFLDIGRSEVTDAGALKLIGLKKLRILIVPDRVTAAARSRLQEAIPDLKFEGRPDEIKVWRENTTAICIGPGRMAASCSARMRAYRQPCLS